MPADHDTTVLVIGGGIGGLTTALALRRHGIDSLVFEQFDDPRKSQAGGGLSLGYNCARAFKKLDLLDELAELGAAVTRFQYTSKKGRHLGTMRMSEGGELQQGVIRRAFHKFLMEKVNQDQVEAGARFVRFEQDGDGVTAHFEDGRTARGDVLVGADGVQSAVRKQLLGESELRYAGYCGRRGVLKTELSEEGLFRVVLGRGQRFLSFPVGGGYLYWTAVTNEPPGEKEQGPDIKRTVLERFEGWPDPVEAIVEATEEANVSVSDTYDREPVERWGEGRATLLGDAAHPMTWDRGEGAGQAVEDAVLLAERLSQGGDPAAALREWEAQRIPPTRKLTEQSLRLGKLQQSENPILRLMLLGWLGVFARLLGPRRAQLMAKREAAASSAAAAEPRN